MVRRRTGIMCLGPYRSVTFAMKAFLPSMMKLDPDQAKWRWIRNLWTGARGRALARRIAARASGRSAV